MEVARVAETAGIATIGSNSGELAEIDRGRNLCKSSEGTSHHKDGSDVDKRHLFLLYSHSSRVGFHVIIQLSFIVVCVNRTAVGLVVYILHYISLHGSLGPFFLPVFFSVFVDRQPSS